MSRLLIPSADAVEQCIPLNVSDLNNDSGFIHYNSEVEFTFSEGVENWNDASHLMVYGDLVVGLLSIHVVNSDVATPVTLSVKPKVSQKCILTSYSRDGVCKNYLCTINPSTGAVKNTNSDVIEPGYYVGLVIYQSKVA